MTNAQYSEFLNAKAAFDQSGNAVERADRIEVLENRGIRGGFYNNSPDWLSRHRSEYHTSWYESAVYSSRVAGSWPAAFDVMNLRAFDPVATCCSWDRAGTPGLLRGRPGRWRGIDRGAARSARSAA